MSVFIDRLTDSRESSLITQLRLHVTQCVVRLREALFGPRLFVCAVLLCASTAIINGYAFNYWWLVLSGVIGFVIGVLSGKKPLMLLFAVLPLLFAWYCNYRTPAPAKNDIASFISSRRLIFVGKVQEQTASKFTGSTQLVISAQQSLFPTNSDVEGKTLVTVYGANNKIIPGDVVRVAGNIASPRHKSYPWQFDYAQFLAKQNIFSICNAQSIQVISHQTSNQQADWTEQFTRWIDTLRNNMLALHRRNLGQLDGDLLTSIVLGNRAVTLSDSVNKKYRDVGLSHVLAASGFNISLAVAMMWWLGKRFMRNQWWQTGLCWFSTVLYVFLAGASPSVMRAAIMIAIVLFMQCLFRKVHAPAVLSAALLAALIADPLSILDVGLQLSYLATIGIIIGASPISCEVAGFTLPNWVLETLLLVLLAQASVLPVQLGVFWQIGLLFLPANLLVDPLVPIITILGFISSMAPLLDFGTGFLNLPAQLVDYVAWCPLRLMTFIVDFLSSFQSAKLLSRPPVPLAVLIYFLMLAVLLGALHFRRFRLGAFAIWLAALCGLLWHAALPDFTLAVFPQAVVVMDKQQRMFCEGEAEHTDAARFISFFGCRSLPQANQVFTEKDLGALKIIHAPSANVALLNLDLLSNAKNSINMPIDKCQVLVIHQQFRSRDTTESIAEDQSTYKTGYISTKDQMNKQYHFIEMLVNQLHPDWVVLDVSALKKRFLYRVIDNLYSIPDLHVLNLSSGAAVLISERKNTGTIFKSTNCTEF